MSAQTYTSTGAKATADAKLAKDIFDLEVKSHDLLKQAYNAYLANGRTNNARTKTRGEVSGGGKKPWKQKGTGRARFGSSRVPIWRGGGITFGPTGNENYSHTLPTGTKRQAVKQALSISNQSGKLVVIESLVSKEGKVKPVIELLQKIGADRKTLIVVEHKDEMLIRATNNLPDVKLVHAQYLNVFDLMNADKVIVTVKAIETIENWLGGKK
jgi:large subunit ribosomal protein L4